MNYRLATVVGIAVAMSGPPWMTAASSGAEPSGSPAEAIRGFQGLYDNVARFCEEPAPCVVLIDPSDPSAVAQSLTHAGGLFRLRRLECRLTALSGLDCFCFHYTQLKRDTLDRPNVKAIVLRAPSPSGVLKCESAREELWAMLRETKTPTIAFCGGFHQVYSAFGGQCGDMRRLRPGETDPNPAYQPGWLKEWGFTKINVTRNDPLFEGLGREVTMLEQHVSECKRLPHEFEVLASSDRCPIQAIKHKSRPLYATQFHPEAYEEEYLDGKQLLLNFFKIAKVAIGFADG